jgi:hypothetical protein
MTSRIGVQAEKLSDGSEIFVVRVKNSAGDVLAFPNSTREGAERMAESLYSAFEDRVEGGVEIKHWS